MQVFSNFLDVVLQVIKEQLHHVQLLLSPPGRNGQNLFLKILHRQPKLFWFIIFYNINICKKKCTSWTKLYSLVCWVKHAINQSGGPNASSDLWGFYGNWKDATLLTWWSSECHSWSQTAGKCRKVWGVNAKKQQLIWKRKDKTRKTLQLLSSRHDWSSIMS